MSQIGATASRLFKELVREKIVVFWTVAFPALWLILADFIFLNGVPAQYKPEIMGVFTVSMCVYALMVAGSVDLPANIAGDRVSGVLLKLKSMPVKPWRDFAGRITAFAGFVVIAIAAVLAMGYALGAKLPFDALGIAEAAAFIGLAFMAASGIGLIIGSFVKREQSASMTGMIFALVGGFVGGIFVTYSSLPAVLQGFAQVFPLSASNNAIIWLLFGEHFMGYNPVTLELVALDVVLSVALFGVGQLLYAKRCWRAQ